MRKRTLQSLSVVLLTIALGSGCGWNESYENVNESYVVGVVTKSSTSEFWMSVNSGMKAAAEKYNMKVIVMSPDSELDEEVQEKQIKKLISQDVDALAVSLMDSYKTPDYLDEIQEKKITAVSFDTGFESADMPYIGIDNYDTGYRLAKVLAEQLNHEGQVGIVAGDLKQKCHRERVEGFKEYMKSETEMQVEFVESGYANLQMSEQKVRDLIKEHPQVKGIMATSGVTAMGLADELRDTEIKIVAVDAQEDSLEAVEKGELTALAAQSGYQLGYETISYIEKLRRKENPEKNYEIEIEILTQENIAQYRRSYEKK